MAGAGTSGAAFTGMSAASAPPQAAIAIAIDPITLRTNVNLMFHPSGNSSANAMRECQVRGPGGTLNALVASNRQVDRRPPEGDAITIPTAHNSSTNSQL